MDLLDLKVRLTKGEMAQLSSCSRMISGKIEISGIKKAVIKVDKLKRIGSGCCRPLAVLKPHPRGVSDTVLAVIDKGIMEAVDGGCDNYDECRDEIFRYSLALKSNEKIRLAMVCLGCPSRNKPESRRQARDPAGSNFDYTIQLMLGGYI